MRVFFCFLAALFALSCGGDEKPKKETFTADTFSEQEVLIGAVTGLMWQSYDPEDVFSYLNRKTYDKAVQYCADLSWAGFNDWRLPTIDELRTIVEGYEDIMWGGRCAVGGDCLQYTCKDKGRESDNDTPCAQRENKYTGPGPDGCYWEAPWRERFCGEYWSTSAVSDSAGCRWGLTFYDPAIFILTEAGSSAFARCVREP